MGKLKEQGRRFIASRFPSAKKSGLRKTLKEHFEPCAVADFPRIVPAAYMLRPWSVDPGTTEIVCFEVVGSANPLDMKLGHYVDAWFWADTESAELTLYLVCARTGGFSKADLRQAYCGTMGIEIGDVAHNALGIDWEDPGVLYEVPGEVH